MSHAEPQLWTENPFQLFDFLLIGEKHVTLSKVSNAIARFGLITAIVMFMKGNERWWLWGLAILLISVGFHYTSVYTQCDAGYVKSSTMSGTILEGFDPSVTVGPNPKRENVGSKSEQEVIPSTVTDYKVHRTTVPYRESIIDEGEQDIETLRDAITYEHGQRMDDMNIVYGRQVDDMVDHLDRQLVREDFSEMYFEPFEVYGREATYASLEPLIH